MNGELERFERLAAKARREPIPPVDVSDRVLQSIRPGVRRSEPEAPLWIMSGVSVAAALVVLAVAVGSGAVAPDPMSEMFQPLTMVMQ